MKNGLNVSNEQCYVSGQFLLCCGGKRLRLFAALSCWGLVFHHSSLRNPRFRSQAMYGVYDGHGPAGHDCSDLSLRRDLDDGTHPLDFRKKWLYKDLDDITIQKYGPGAKLLAINSWVGVLLRGKAETWLCNSLGLARKLCSAFLNDPDRERDPGAVLTKARP